MTLATVDKRTHPVMHEEGCSILLCPWDIGRARFLQFSGPSGLIPVPGNAGSAWAAERPENTSSCDMRLRLWLRKMFHE